MANQLKLNELDTYVTAYLAEDQDMLTFAIATIRANARNGHYGHRLIADYGDLAADSQRVGDTEMAIIFKGLQGLMKGE